VTRIVLIFGICILFISCNISPVQNNFASGNQVWVYIEIQSTLLRDTTDYYYYGQIKQSVIDKIDNNSFSDGLFILSEIRYLDNENKLRIFADEEDFGYKIFRINDIQYVSPLKKDPIYFFEPDDLHDSARKLRNDL
jgi:hypothetical protein